MEATHRSAGSLLARQHSIRAKSSLDRRSEGNRDARLGRPADAYLTAALMVFCSMWIRHRRPSNLYEDDNTFFISTVYAINVPRSKQPMPTDARPE
jgi:transposase InsO family protein